jgi:hypothetical protein
MERWRDGEMERWRDGEKKLVQRAFAGSSEQVI